MFSRSLSDFNNPSVVQFVTSVFWFPFDKFFKGYWLTWTLNHGYLSLVMTRAGETPTPQENLSLVEQASCLFLKMAGKMPTPQENLNLLGHAPLPLLHTARGLKLT